MTNCLGKSCSFGLLCAFRKLLSINVLSCFPFGFEGRMWDLIVSVPDHCLSFYFPFFMCANSEGSCERLRGCAGSPEPSLVAYVINTIIS